MALAREVAEALDQEAVQHEELPAEVSAVTTDGTQDCKAVVSEPGKIIGNHGKYIGNHRCFLVFLCLFLHFLLIIG